MAARPFTVLRAGCLLTLLGVSPALPAERLSFATAIKLTPGYYLPIMAAEEKGFWQDAGLQVEWVPFQSTIAMHHAITAGSIRIGLDQAVALIPGVVRGVPAIMVASVQVLNNNAFWVRVDSSLRGPGDLKKGVRMGVPSLGGTSFAMARMLVRALGLEKEVRFVATGGIAQNVAALRAGAVQVISASPIFVASLAARGEVRAIAEQQEHVRAQLLGQVAWARKDFLRNQPQTAASAVKAILRAGNFVQGQRAWAMEKIKEMQGLPANVAEIVYQLVKFSPDGAISEEALKDTTNFLLEFDLLPREKAPRMEDMYTTKLLQ